jgi:hypothetical protein
MPDKPDRIGRRNGIRKCANHLRMLRDGPDILPRRRCAEAGQIDRDKPKAVRKRRLEERREGKSAVGKSMNEEKRSAVPWSSRADEHSICQRYIHRRLLLDNNAADCQCPRCKLK